MNTFPAEFLNVDLDIKSSSDPAVIAKVWENRVIPMHADKLGRHHWLRLALALQPKSPSAAIRRFATLIRDLPPKGRRAWARATSKEFDIGIQAGFERRSGEWLLETASCADGGRLGRPNTIHGVLPAADYSRKRDPEPKAQADVSTGLMIYSW